jgi:sigma-B regulation protein RsbU (phosphoserine phosphatase)
MNHPASLASWKGPLGRLEKVFLALLLLDLVLYFFPAASGTAAIVTLVVYILGTIVAVRLVRRNLKKVLWRLRNRLIVSYLFIAVVPIALVMLLVAIGGYVLMGQIAVYAVNAEVDRHSAGLAGVEPSPELLSNLAPSLGDVLLMELKSGSNPDFSFKDLRRSRMPPPSNPLDIQLRWFSPMTFQSRSYLLAVRSRPSAVLGTIFGQKMEWERFWMLAFIVVAGLFLIVQVGSIVVGASMTRTITGAVHNLYEGTQKVKSGDFSHRIAVRGGDQLAELSLEFNRMSENLQRLIVVEKERERLHSQLEIARDVQIRLFPKTALSLPALHLSGVCHPAQQVSGDYYDFLLLEDSSLAMAIGDVAGKGISAALLMATIQSAMRSHLARAGLKSPAQIVSLLNRQIYASTAPEKYATFFFSLYEDSTGMLTYTNAGHLQPILVRDGGTHKLDGSGLPVGLFPSSLYEEKQIALLPGDLLVAYTDGITEPEDAYGEMFGEERLIDVLIKHQNAESGEIVARLMEAILEWTGSPELQDDMTMLITRRTGA